MVEQAGFPEWDPQVRADFKVICVEYATIWAAGAPEDQAKWKANGEEMKKGWESDKDTLVAELTETFNAAATNEDKLLNEAQFVDFAMKMEANYEAKGWVLPKKSEELLKRSYVILNKVSPGADGLSLMDIWNQFEKQKEIMAEARAETAAAMAG